MASLSLVLPLDVGTAPDEGKIDRGLIQFNLQCRGAPVTLYYQRAQLRTASGSDYLSALLDPPTTEELARSSPFVAHVADFSTYQATTFTHILDALLYRKVGPLSDQVNPVELDRLAAYLGLHDSVAKVIYVDSKLLYPLCLTPDDLDLRKWEASLRNILFKAEETDYRSYDSNLLFSTTCEEMGYVIGPSEVDWADMLHRGAFGVDRLCEKCVEQGYSVNPDPMNVYSGRRSKYGHLYCNRHDSKSNPVDPNFSVQNRSFGDVQYPVLGMPHRIGVTAERANVAAAFLEATEGAFENLDWSDLCVAGGSIYNLQTGLFDNGGKPRGSGQINDFDFNLITKNSILAAAAIRRVLTAFENYWVTERGHSVLVVRTEHAITMSTTLDAADEHHLSGTSQPRMKIQIILRLYNSIAQVISGFDIDACAAAFDGTHTYALPRYVRALQTGTILVDPERQSANYHHRLFKYLDRGLALAFPGYSSKRVVAREGSSTGLAKVLTYLRERMEKVAAHFYSSAPHGSSVVALDRGDYGEDFLLTSRTRLRAYVARQAVRTYHRRVRVGDEPKLGQRAQVDRLVEIITAPAVYLTSVSEQLPIRCYRSVVQLFGEPIPDEAVATPEEYAPILNQSTDSYRRMVKPTAAPLHLWDRPGRWEDYNLSTRIFDDNREGDFDFPSSLPEELIFKTRNVADQTTNSFHPTSEEWYHDLYVAATAPTSD